MAIAVSQFERVAEAIAQRASELLGTAVSVVDERGIVVSSSQPWMVGLVFEVTPECIRVPLRLDSGCGEVLVCQPEGSETFPPRLAGVLIELIIDQTAVVDRLPNKHELKDKFIYDLLCGSIGDESAILREAQVLGMDLTPPRAVMLVDACGYIEGPARPGQADVEVRRRAQIIISSIVDFFKLPSDTICAYIGGSEVAILKASNRKNLAFWVAEEHGHDQASPSWANLDALKRAGTALVHRLRCDTGAAINLGVGRYHPGLRGLARSYQDARAALVLGRRFRDGASVHCLDDLGVAAFVGVADERTKVELATYLLRPLDHEPEMLATLDAFFTNDCSPIATAKQLCIHRNTLGYRLDKITSLTGLDPRRFDEAVQIRLAMVLRAFPPQMPDWAIAQ